MWGFGPHVNADHAARCVCMSHLFSIIFVGANLILSYVFFFKMLCKLLKNELF